MNFDISEEQEELRRSVRAVLEQECPVAVARERAESDRTPAQPWRAAVELGWTAMAVPEAHAGLGLGFAELALVLEEHGRCLAAGPFLPTTTQLIPALCAVGSDAQRERFLAAAAAGELSGSLALASRAGDLRCGALKARRSGSAWSISGTAHYVMEAEAVDEFVVAARVDEGDGAALLLVPSSAAKIDRLIGLDPSRPLASVALDEVEVGPERVLGTPGSCRPALEAVLARATAGLAIETVGSCQALFDLTVDHARQREQFGRPIGAFQAIAHKLADALLALEKARATALFAAMTIDEDDPRRSLGVSMAKAQAGACQRLIAKEAIQIHGGLGYTWEQDVHLFVKRIKAGDALFGTARRHRAHIAELLGA